MNADSGQPQCRRERLVVEPTPTELDRLALRLERVATAAPLVPEPSCAFLLLSPFGVPYAELLLDALERLGVHSGGRTPVSAALWPGLDTVAHVRSTAPHRVRRAALYEAAWRTLFPSQGGELWELPRASAPVLLEAKPRLRALLPRVEVQFVGSDVSGELHAFHVGDPPDVSEEARRLLAALDLEARS